MNNASVESGTTKTEEEKKNYVLQLGNGRFQYTKYVYYLRHVNKL